MQTKMHIKNKILLLMILAIAAGIILVLPQKNTTSKKTAQPTAQVNQKQNKETFNCDKPNKAVAKVLDQNEIDLGEKTCLYVGCGGFTY